MNKIRESGLLTDYQFADEIVRTLVRERGIKINEEGEFNSQVAVFRAHKKNVENYANLITDRCCLDAMVYTLHNRKDFTTREINIFQRYFDETLPQYDLIFYLPVEFEVKDDGFRSTNEIFRRKIDEYFKALILIYDIKVVTLTGSIEERLKLFKEEYEKSKGISKFEAEKSKLIKNKHKFFF